MEQQSEINGTSNNLDFMVVVQAFEDVNRSKPELVD
jgi:hypothetical protein